MALKATFDYRGISYPDSYHKISKIEIIRSKKVCRIDIDIYANEAFRNSTLPGEGIDFPLLKTFILIEEVDFDNYINNTTYEQGEYYQEKSCYEFLKTICPTEENSKYPNFLVDYKNNSIDV
jgi:hypothetical protein